MRRIKIIALLIYLSPFLVYSSNHFSISLWLHSSMFPNDKKTAINELNERLDFYKEIGVENLYVFNTLKSEHKKGWNYLKYILKIAHSKGLKVHPVVTSGHRVRVEGKIKKHPEWLIKDPFGKKLPYLNLSNPEVRKYIQKKVKKILKYDVDGIHLDYIRFPYLTKKNRGDSVISIMIRIFNTMSGHFIPDHIYHGVGDNYFSYDERTPKRFEEYYMKEFGLETSGNRQEARGRGQSKTKSKIRNEKNGSGIWDSGSGKKEAENGMVKDEGLYPLAIGGASHVLNEWHKWNAANVTKLVRGVRDIIKRSKKFIPLSAAIISNREFAFHSLGQDWGKWGKSGLVDVICPMIYSNDNSWFKERLKGVLETVQKGCKVYAGIAIKSSTNTNSPEGVASQIRIAKGMRANGIVIFSGFSLNEEFGIKIREAGRRKQAALRNSVDKTGRTPVARNLSPEINFELK